MASLYKKLINRKPYWYLREMARVEGRPRMVSERYLGTAADIAAAVAGRDAAALPTRTRHLGFGDAAAWGRADSAGGRDPAIPGELSVRQGMSIAFRHTC